MTYQHKEFQTWLRDVERLRLYAQSIIFYHRALSASLAEAESSFRGWENEAKESVDKMVRVQGKRNTARHDASKARMDADSIGNVRAKVESELARVQNALAVVKEARWKVEGGIRD